MTYSQGHPMFEQLPDGRNAIRALDGSLIAITPVNVRMEVSATTAVIPANGAPVVMSVIDALALQTTLAAHWLHRWQEGQTELADLRAKLTETQSEGRVYELDPDIAVTTEEFADLKEMQKVAAEELNCDSADDLRALANECRLGRVRPLPSEMEIALAALGFTSLGGLREFCEHYKIPVPEVARG